MKKLYALCIMSALGAGAFAQTFTSPDGSWSESSSWADGSVPDVGTSSGVNSITVNFTPSSGTESTILLDRATRTSALTLLIGADTTAEEITFLGTRSGDDKATVINASNYQSGVINLAAQDNDDLFQNKVSIVSSIKKGVTVNVLTRTPTLAINLEGNIVFNSQTTLKNFTMNGTAGGGDLTICSGNSLTSTYRLNLHAGTLTVEEGATLKMTGASSGLRMRYGVISGTLDLSSGGDFNNSQFKNGDHFSIAFGGTSGGKVVFTNTGSLTYSLAAGKDVSRPRVTGELYVGTAAGAMKFSQDLQLTDKSTLILNSANAFSMNGGKARFVVSNLAPDSYDVVDRDGVADAQLIIGKDADTGASVKVDGVNTVENIYMYSGSTLGLALNGNKLIIDEINAFDSRDDNDGIIAGESMYFTIWLNDFIQEGNLVIGKLYDAVTTDDVYNYVQIGNSLDGEILVSYVNGHDNADGFSIALVPEPATIAAIFGALALAIAAYRRRK